jgi:tRNA threonylcarbamoyladenosine biosynthesis protein TsaE
MQHNKTDLSETELLSFAGALANAVNKGAIIYLNGQLGAGKTTFSRGFLRSLGFQDKVKSPTYTIVEPYEIADRKIYHFDLYRLHDAEELEHIGIYEYFTPDAICLIEWPEKGFPLLPSPDLTCKITIKDNNRDICIEANTALGETILKQL